MSALDQELQALGLNMEDLEDLTASNTIVGVLYGPNGGGKTTQFDTLPPKSATLFNVERGERSLVGSKAGNQIKITGLGQFARLLVAIKKDIATGDYDKQYLFVDSATDLYKKEIATQGKISAADPDNKQSDPDVPSPRDYMKVGKKVDRVINYAKDMPLTVIFTAMEQPVMDDQKIERIGPAMSPSVRDSFVMYSDFVCYLQTLSDGRRVMVTQQQGKIIAKTRMPVGKHVPTKILNPNLYDFIRAIRGENVKFESF